MSQLGQQQQCNRSRKVDGQNPERPSYVKITGATPVVSSIDEDACNQEAGKNEEQIDAGPAALLDLPQYTHEARTSFAAADVVKGVHQKDRNAAHAVQCGNVPFCSRAAG